MEDENGQIRKGDLVMFYAAGQGIIDMPANSFTRFFTTQSLEIDGTFALVSLADIKQYEMDIEEGNPKEFRAWEGRAPVYNGDNIVCVDWYQITTIYYSDGTIEEFVDFLYTQCYGGSGGVGGGGNGSTPPDQTHYPVTRRVTFTVASVSAAYEGWTLYADYNLSGECYPGTPSQSYFTGPPVPVDGSGTSNSHMLFHSGTMHSVPWHSWYLVFQLQANNVSLLTGNKTAKAQFSAHLTFPNQSPVRHRYPGNSKTWPAAIALH
ncbi:MAG: hypothetical protein H7Y86_06135 [Rhizobacter sp.]|nr:hypothetical protein [Ferruginibacter sp.]